MILKYKNFFLFFLSIVLSLANCHVSSAQSVGINTSDPKSSFEVSGSFGQTVRTVTGNTTLTSIHGIVVCNNGSTAITITLPDATACSGRIYTIKRDASSTANVTLARTASQTIDGAAANLILAKAGEVETLFSNGTEWKTLSNYNSSSSSSTSWSVTGNSGTGSSNFIGSTDAQPLVLKTNNTEQLRILSGGNIGIGVTDPTAYLHLKAGTAAEGTAPLKLTAGPLMRTEEPGAIEYKDHTFYATTYLVRRSIMLAQDVIVTPVTVADTKTETTIYTSTMAADYLTAGKLINIKLYGRFGTNGKDPLNLFTVRVNLDGSPILTTVSTSQDATDRPFDIDIRSTVRSIGERGAMMSYGKIQQDNTAANMDISKLLTIDTTRPNTITVTIQWITPDPANTLTLEGGATECVDPNN